MTAGSNTPGLPPRVACGGDYLCTAKKGYDAPTGLGTPNGPGGRPGCGRGRARLAG